MWLQMWWWRLDYHASVLLWPLYSLGFYSGLCILAQLLSGFVAASNFVSEEHIAFHRIHEYFMLDSHGGFILRFVHHYGASCMMAVVLLHILRVLYQMGEDRPLIMSIGLVLWAGVAGTCFSGYSLIDGQTSYWAIVVFSKYAASIPWIGTDLEDVIIGAYEIGTPAYGRFLANHMYLALFTAGFVLAHVWALHQENSAAGSRNLNWHYQRYSLLPSAMVRDLTLGAALISASLISIGVYIISLSDCENFSPSDPLLTPAEIKPEWYFLPLYGLIRSVPVKLLGLSLTLLYILAILPIAENNPCCFSSSFVHIRINIILFMVDNFIVSYTCLCLMSTPSLYILVLSSGIFILSSNLSVTAPSMAIMA